LTYVGHKFANDSALAAQWPDLNRSAIKTAHTSGKTSWDDQHVIAAEAIVARLRKEQVLKSGSQIFGWELFNDAAVHKAAEIIYSAFGEQKEEERQIALQKYDAAMNQSVFNSIDKDADGVLSTDEKFRSISFGRV
jgi:hypothetical protein